MDPTSSSTPIPDSFNKFTDLLTNQGYTYKYIDDNHILNYEVNQKKKEKWVKMLIINYHRQATNKYIDIIKEYKNGSWTIVKVGIHNMETIYCILDEYCDCDIPTKGVNE